MLSFTEDPDDSIVVMESELEDDLRSDMNAIYWFRLDSRVSKFIVTTI